MLFDKLHKKQFNKKNISMGKVNLIKLYFKEVGSIFAFSEQR